MRRLCHIGADLALVAVLFCGQMALAAWVPIYSEDFSSDPGWTTDDPAKLRWESGTQSFRGTQVNTEGTYAYTNVLGFDPNQSWRLEFDTKINSCDWSAGWDIGLFDSNVIWPLSASVHQGIADPGYGTALTGYNHVANDGSTFSPPWSTGTWYRHTLEYDPMSNVLKLHTVDLGTGSTFMDLSMLVSSFPSDLTYLGVSRAHMKNTGAGASPTATVDYNLDNITLSVPEPGSVGMLGLMGLWMIRRVRKS